MTNDYNKGYNLFMSLVDYGHVYTVAQRLHLEWEFLGCLGAVLKDPVVTFWTVTIKKGKIFMAEKTPAEKAGKNTRKTPYNKKRYVKVTLDPKERTEVMKMHKDGLRVLDALQYAVLAGYRIRVVHDKSLDSYSVLVDGDDTKANAGLVLEQQASSLTLALAAAAYKVVEKCDFGSWLSQTEEEDWFS